MLRRQDFLPGACRPVIKSYDWEAQNLEVASRALKLIDEMVLPRTQGLEEHLSELDRWPFCALPPRWRGGAQAGTVNCHGGGERGGD